MNQVAGIYKDAEHVYVNLCISSQKFGQQPYGHRLGSVLVQRDQPIVDRPSEYNLSVVRFRVPTQVIPIAIARGYNGFEYKAGGTLGNVAEWRLRDLLDWAVVIDYNNQMPATEIVVPNPLSITSSFATGSVTNLAWTAEVTNAGLQEFDYPLPGSATLPANTSAAPAPLEYKYNPQTASNSGYFFMYSYQHLVSMINVALATAFVKAQTLPGFPGAATVAPYLTLDSKTNLMTLVAQTAFVSTAATPIKIYFNTSLMEGAFGRSFRAVYEGTPAPVNENFWLQVLDYNGSNSVTVNGGGGAGYAMIQEYSSLSVLSDFETLAISSASLPIAPGFGYIPKPLGGTFPLGSSPADNEGAPLVPLITDVIADSADGIDVRSYVSYVPTAEYRLIDMVSAGPISNISVQMFWSDPLGNFFPVIIPSGACVTAKLMFRKKTGLPIGEHLKALEALH